MNSCFSNLEICHFYLRGDCEMPDCQRLAFLMQYAQFQAEAASGGVLVPRPYRSSKHTSSVNKPRAHPFQNNSFSRLITTKCANQH
jgi:hypothetical protein